MTNGDGGGGGCYTSRAEIGRPVSTGVEVLRYKSRRCRGLVWPRVAVVVVVVVVVVVAVVVVGE